MPHMWLAVFAGTVGNISESAWLGTAGWYVWNNTGDKATSRDSSGALKDTCSWGDSSDGVGAARFKPGAP
jgi:hypothetical protein